MSDVSAAVHAELSAIVLESQPLGVVLRHVADLAVKTLPDVEDASVTLVERGRAKTVAFSGHLAVALDERQYAEGFGPCLDAAFSGQTIEVDTADEAGAYPDFCRQARREGVRHVLAIGLPALERTSAALNLYLNEGPPAETAREIATAFAGYASVTLFNATAYAGALEEVAQMREALTSRAVIEQAKGIIMSQNRCSAERAFAILTKKSSLTNRKLRDVARDIVDRTVSG